MSGAGGNGKAPSVADAIAQENRVEEKLDALNAIDNEPETIATGVSPLAHTEPPPGTRFTNIGDLDPPFDAEIDTAPLTPMAKAAHRARTSIIETMPSAALPLVEATELAKFIMHNMKSHGCKTAEDVSRFAGALLSHRYNLPEDILTVCVFDSMHEGQDGGVHIDMRKLAAKLNDMGAGR